MSNSLTFNGSSLTGLKIINRNSPNTFSVDSVLIQSKSYAADPKNNPLIMSLPVIVIGDDVDDLESKLDTIKRILNETRDRKLILDALSDRYWMGRVRNFSGEYNTRQWQGTLEFICNDPLAYSTTETNNSYTIDASPKTALEVTSGSAIIRPEYRLTVGETHTEITIKNEANGDELVWTGTIDNGETLTIDCDRWMVYLDDVASMTISGQFPRLLPGETNPIKVTGAYTAANSTLQIVYRNRYL